MESCFCSETFNAWSFAIRENGEFQPRAPGDCVKSSKVTVYLGNFSTYIFFYVVKQSQSLPPICDWFSSAGAQTKKNVRTRTSRRTEMTRFDWSKSYLTAKDIPLFWDSVRGRGYTFCETGSPWLPVFGSTEASRIDCGHSLCPPVEHIKLSRLFPSLTHTLL